MSRFTFIPLALMLALGAGLGYVVASGTLSSMDPLAASRTANERGASSERCHACAAQGHSAKCDACLSAAAPPASCCAEKGSTVVCCEAGVSRSAMLVAITKNNDATKSEATKNIEATKTNDATKADEATNFSDASPARAGLELAQVDLAQADRQRKAGGGSSSKKPNILVIWGDDIGQTNISAYSKGLMGYRTPNIDRIANEGMIFTDYYAEQSCTAGRAAFILGQSVFRSGLSKVGLPGASLGSRPEDPTIAEVLRPMGYATGQFGKNHLGDRDEHLPTMHGFDEFFGNLYHLNAEEEPELRDYPSEKDFPNFRKKYGPRGVLHCWANADGTQKIENTGPLTKKRMETVDDEFLAGAIDFIKRQKKADKPFFVWFNTTHMHFRTHEKPESKGQSGRWQSEYHDVMIDHDKHVGALLALLDELGIADDTFVMYSTDNGPHMNSWPDAGMTPFRNEKNSNWEGAYRVPAMVRWPGHIKAGSVSNDIISHLDWLPTFAAMAGDTGIKEKLLKGTKLGNKSFKVHLDGYNQLPLLTGKDKEDPRKEFFYFSDDGDLVALRYDNWKAIFAQQRAEGTLLVWSEPFVKTRIPWLFNLRTDPYERATITSNSYWDWYFDHVFLLVPMQHYVADFMATFKDFPPRQKAASFTIDQVMDQLKEGAAGR